MSTDTLEPLVVSMSDFENYTRCRKLFDLSYMGQLTPRGTKSEAAEKGTELHAILRNLALGNEVAEFFDSDMYPVAIEYVKHNPFPTNIISVEQPMYTLVLPQESDFGWPALYLRTTFDIVHEDDGFIVSTDYKSFEKAPSLNPELDFQARTYSVVLRRFFQTDKVIFRWQYIRRELGRHLKNGTVYTPWEPSECYIATDLVMSELEAHTTWSEIVATASDVRSTYCIVKDSPLQPNPMMYRKALKAGPHSCEQCFYRQLCVAEYTHGQLDENDRDLFAQTTDPAERATAAGIRTDPRVVWATTFNDDSFETAVRRYYGENGLLLTGKEAV